MILTINGKTIQTFGAHRLVQGENRPEPITFRVTMPKASEMSWYLGYKRQDGTGEEAVSLEVSQASGNVDDLYLTWYPSRTATHVPGKLGIIVYGLQANVTPEGGDRRWSTYPTQLIIAQGQTVESAEPVDPSVFEQALIDLTALVEQALGIKTDVQALKEEAGAYLAQIITLASEVEANAIKVAALEGSAKASAESAAESATEAGRKATIAETASNMASESASRANEKAGDASASATLAREYKNDAQSSAENAQAGARAAEQSASSAQESAERAERVGIEADRVIAEVEAVGEEKKQQINTEAEEKIGEIIAEGATQVEAVRGVYQEDLGQLTSHLTDLSEDTYRKAEVDSKVAEATPSDYASLKNKVTNLEYENRIVSAVIKKKIAEETEMSGNVIDFPVVDGYPLAEWGLLKRLKSESLVWNQMVGDAYRSGVSSVSDTKAFYLSVRGYNGGTYESYHLGAVQKGIFTLIFAPRVDATEIRVLHDGSQRNLSLMAFTASIKSGNVYMLEIEFSSADTSTVGGVAWSRCHMTDLTVTCGVTSVSAVTEAMKTFVRQYAEAHPQYDAGSLVSAVYESGVSRSGNVFNKDDAPVRDNAYLVASTGAYVSDAISYCFRIDVNGGAIYELENASDATSGNYNTAGVVYYNSSGQTVGYEAYSKRSFIILNVPIDASYMIMTARKDGTTEYKDTSASKIVLRRLSSLDLSFLNSVPDIGIEGTVVDFEREEVTWNYGNVDLGSLRFRASSSGSGRFYCEGDGLIPYAPRGTATSFMADIYKNYPASNFPSGTWDLMGDMAITLYSADGIPMRGVYITDSRFSSADDFNAYVNGKKLVYELATPLTRSFSDLGITIPDSWDGGKPWIRVEAGGKFTVVSSGADAEATVSFLTDLGGN